MPIFQGVRRPILGTNLTGTLLDDLSAHYKLEEASGTRFDAHINSLHLNDVNTVGQNTGIQGNCAEFTSANSEGLSLLNPDPIPWLTPGGFSCAANLCVFQTAKTGSGSTMMMGKDENSGSQREWSFRYNIATDRWQFAWFYGVGLNDFIIGNTFGAVPLNEWHMLTMVSDADTTRVSFYIDAVEQGTSTTSRTIKDNGSNGGDFSIGSTGNGDKFFDGRIDEASFWKGKTISTTQIEWLYNNGNGRGFAEFGKRVV